MAALIPDKNGYVMLSKENIFSEEHAPLIRD